ncbi:MAG TPA: transposase [Vicinamibacterales bacterium]|nr:transposase [Vicinamibacterales bacterium]
MLNEATDARRQRGLEIAATAPIARKGEGEWLVPSQSLNGRYRVVKGVDGFQCSCPDYELRGQTCKHGFAVEFFLRRETKPDGTVIETRAARVTYSQNWPAYNKAQTSEKEQFCTLLRDLVSDVPSPEQKRGRPSLPLADMIFSAAFKVYSTVSGRRFMTDLRTATTLGLIDRTPHYNSIFNVLDRESLTPILQELITRSAMPLKGLETDFAIDSTGFGTQSFYRHYSAKYGHDQFSRDYLKLHVVVGTKTNVVAAAQVTDRNTHDSPLLPGLAAETAERFDVQRLSADKGYASHRNIEAIDAIGATPFVAFTANAKGNSKSSLWNKAFHFFSLNRDEFLTAYHRRSNVESTFSAMKRKFGEIIRSKTPVAQRNELLLKVLCHNIVCVIHEIHESGATALFPALTAGCPKTLPAAQQVQVLE